MTCLLRLAFRAWLIWLLPLQAHALFLPASDVGATATPSHGAGTGSLPFEGSLQLEYDLGLDPPLLYADTIVGPSGRVSSLEIAAGWHRFGSGMAIDAEVSHSFLIPTGDFAFVSPGQSILFGRAAFTGGFTPVWSDVFAPLEVPALVGAHFTISATLPQNTELALDWVVEGSQTDGLARSIVGQLESQVVLDSSRFPLRVDQSDSSGLGWLLFAHGAYQRQRLDATIRWTLLAQSDFDPSVFNESNPFLFQLQLRGNSPLVTTVPEPATLGLSVVGLTISIACARRSRAR